MKTSKIQSVIQNSMKLRMIPIK